MNAKWIWIDTDTTQNSRMIYFKKKIFIPENHSSECRVRICADSRYTLYINRKRIITGPCRSADNVWYADEIDISKFLQGGENEIFVKAIQYACNKYKSFRFLTGPNSILTEGVGGLYIEETDTDYGIDTSDEYLCMQAEGYYFPEDNIKGYVGYMERIDARHTYEDMPYEYWRHAEVLHMPARGEALRSFWMLEPRPIPMMYEEEASFKRALRTQNAENLSAEKINDEKSCSHKIFTYKINSGVSAAIELDAGRLVSAYPRIEFTCADGCKLKIIYAEGYGTEDENGAFIRGVRDMADGQHIYGHTDEYTAREGRQTYIPFLYRSFRVVKIEIDIPCGSSEPFIIHNIDYIKTGYPLKIEGTFKSDDKIYEKLWNIGVRTLKRCMFDTYMDCPYYEQMQYAMDTFLEIRYTLSISSDYRLAKKAIKDFAQAQLHDGMIPCNSPSKFMQIIPGFPFYWVLMIDTYMMYVGDKQFIRSNLSTIDKLFEYYRLRINEKGILGNTGYWQFFDWVKEWNNGCPVSDKEDNILYSMLYVYALRTAAGLNRFCGRNDTAEEYENDARSISEAIIKNAYDADSGLFSDAPGRKPSSMHAQIFAVLSDIVSEDEAKTLMLRMIRNKSALSVPSYCMMYFLCRALEKTGMYDEIHSSFKMWDVFIRLSEELHLSTWPEDFVTLRSDCHGWSAVMLYEFAACYLGVQPVKPGCSEIRVRPLPCPLKKYSGQVPVGDKGIVAVEIDTDESGKRTVKVHAPEGVKCVCDFSQISKI